TCNGFSIGDRQSERGNGKPFRSSVQRELSLSVACGRKAVRRLARRFCSLVCPRPSTSGAKRAKSHRRPFPPTRSRRDDRGSAAEARTRTPLAQFFENKHKTRDLRTERCVRKWANTKPLSS